MVEHDGDIFAVTDTGYVRIDGETRTVEHRSDHNMLATWNAQLIAVTQDAVWIGTDPGVVRVNLADDSVDPIEGVVGQPAGAADGVMWVVAEDEVIAVDATTGAVVERHPAPPEAGALGAMTPGPIDASIWAVGFDDPMSGPGQSETVSLVRFDIASGTFDVRPIIHTDGYNVGVAAVGEDAWASDFGRGNVVRVDLLESPVS